MKNIWKKPQLFDFLMEVMLLVVLFVMPTIFDRRLGIVFSGTKVTWMRTLGIILLSLWSVKILVLRQHRFVRTVLDWPVAAFLLSTTIATLTSVHVYTSFVGFYGRYEGLSSWYLFGLFFFVTTNFIKNFSQLKRMIITVTSAATLMAVYSILQRFNLDPYMWGGVVTWQRVIGMIGQPNFLAAYMLMAFFLGLIIYLLDHKQDQATIDWFEQAKIVGYFLLVPIIFLLMIFNLEAHDIVLWYGGFFVITLFAILFAYTYQRLEPLVLKTILAIALLLNYTCILYTQSRGGYLGLFSALVVFALIAGRKWLFAGFKYLLILALLIITISGITMMQPEFSPLTRFSSEITTVDDEQAEMAESKLELKGAAGSRGETWKSGFKIIADYPLFGIGPEVLKMVFPRYETDLFRFKEAFHVKQDREHNETFDVSVTKGLISFFLYFWIIFLLFQQGIKKARNADPAQRLFIAGCLAAIFAYLIQNQFSFGVVAIVSLFWIIWAMVMVVGQSQADQYPDKEINWLDLPWLPLAAVVLLAGLLIYVSFFSFRGDIWFKSGKTKMGMRRIPQAIEDFKQSLKVFPYEGTAVSHLGISYLNLSYMSKDLKQKSQLISQAINTFNYGTKVDPYNADNFYLLSKIYLMLASMGNPNTLSLSKQMAEKAIKIDPYYAEVYQVLGLIAQKQGNKQKAQQYYKRSFFINPHLGQAMDLYEQISQKEKVLAVYEQLNKKYPGIPNVLERLSKHYLEAKQYSRAEKAANRLLPVIEGKSKAYILRARARLGKNQLNQAFSDLQQALFLDPQNVGVHLWLAELYLKQGKIKRAKEEFEQVLQLDPNNQRAKNYLK